MNRICKLFFLLAAVVSFEASGQAPNNIEIVLNTDGDLKLDGSQFKAVTTNKAQSLVNDNLVKQYSETKETKIFTTKAEAKNNKKHQPLEVNVPDGSLVTIQTQIGDVTLDNVNASVSGYILSGNIALNNTKGEVELVSEQGDITATNMEAAGMLTARSGNIRLTNVTGIVRPHAPQGKISIAIGADYYKKSPKPIDLSLPVGEIEISTAPYGGKVQMGKGKLTVSEVSQKLEIKAESANILLRGVSAPLSLSNQGNVSVQLVKFTDNKEVGQKVNIETTGGDVTLELAKNFVGSLIVWTTETNPVGEKSLVVSAVSLGKSSVADNGFGDDKVNVRETTNSAVIGKGGPEVTVHVTNGKVIIKN